MAAKAMNFKMSEAEVKDIREVASVFHMTMTEVVKNAVDEYVAKMKKDPYYRLTANVREADPQEASEILSAVDGLSDDDLAIAEVRHFEA